MTARSGAVISEQTFGETVADAYGIPFTLAADGKWYRADASDPLLSLGDVALCIETIVAADGTGSLLKYGYVQKTGWTWALGQPVYFGATPGTLTQTKPAGNTIRYAGYPVAADALWFSPTDPILAEYLSLELPPGTEGDYLYHNGVAWTAHPLDPLPEGTQGDLLYHNGTAWVPTEAGALRNWIINGNFAVNQRAAATKAQAAGVYGYDRWKGHANGIEQVVEALPAGEYTLSWSGGGTGYLDGTSGTSPITKTVAGGNTSVVVPADADEVVLNAGSVALPFAPRPYAEELALCQRYYWRLSADEGDIFVGLGFGLSSTTGRILTGFPTTMRVAPTMSFSDASHFQISQTSGGAFVNTTLTGLSGVAINPDSAYYSVAMASGGIVSGMSFLVLRSGAGRYLAFSAEL